MGAPFDMLESIFWKNRSDRTTGGTPIMEVRLVKGLVPIPSPVHTERDNPESE
jgi:hypothetical protein